MYALLEPHKEENCEERKPRKGKLQVTTYSISMGTQVMCTYVLV